MFIPTANAGCKFNELSPKTFQFKNIFCPFLSICTKNRAIHIRKLREICIFVRVCKASTIINQRHAMDKDELKKHKEEFLGLLRSTGIEDIDYFIAELEKSGFFTAPASMNGHMCYEGGLMIHSLNVYYAAIKLKEVFAPMRPDIFDKISDESIIVAALLHDMCKSNLYFRKRDSRYEMGQAQYGSDYGNLPIGHGEKSVVMLLQMGLGLTDAEICAIRWHMGAWSVNDCDAEEKGNFRKAADLYPLVSLIQLADTAAAGIIECKYTTIN